MVVARTAFLLYLGGTEASYVVDLPSAQMVEWWRGPIERYIWKCTAKDCGSSLLDVFGFVSAFDFDQVRAPPAFSAIF